MGKWTTYAKDLWRGGTGMGCIPDEPDERDHTVSFVNYHGHSDLAQPITNNGLSGQVLYSGHVASFPKDFCMITKPAWIEVQNQGKVGSCGGFATVYAVVADVLRQTKGKVHPRLSQLLVYKMAREKLGITGDSGSTIRSCAWVASKLGLADEEDWPYTDRRFPTGHYYDSKPASWIRDSAQANRVKRYWRLDVGPSQIVELVQRTLIQGFPVVLGADLFDRGDRKGRFKDSGKLIGRHALCVIGYGHDVNSGLFFFGPNSWGMDWGDNGFFRLTQFHVRNHCRDFWTIADVDFQRKG